MDYTILTFARCGSNYLQQLIKQKLYDPSNPGDMITVPKTHFISEVKTEKMISIIRCPSQSMNSLVALVLTFPESPKFKTTEEDGTFRFPAQEYIDIYKHLIDNEAILIDYRDLISRPDEVIAYLAKEMNLEVRDVDYVNELVDLPDHLVSSTTSPLWDNIDYARHLPGNFKMFECKYEYNRAIEKCILR